MSLIEGIGDDLLGVCLVLFFLALIALAWLSTHVCLPLTFVQIESLDFFEQSSSANETFSEQEFELSTNEVEPSLQQTPSSIDEEDGQVLRITIKFLNETQKLISVNANDTILKIKRSYFADELSNNQIIRFIYQGRELEDWQTLRRYHIRDQTIIHCQITSPHRHSTPIRLSSSHPDTSSFFDLSPISISFHFLILSSLFLVLVWYFRLNYRVLFTPISTILLILITVLFLIFTYGSFLSSTSRTDLFH